MCQWLVEIRLALSLTEPPDLFSHLSLALCWSLLGLANSYPYLLSPPFLSSPIIHVFPPLSLWCIQMSLWLPISFNFETWCEEASYALPKCRLPKVEGSIEPIWNRPSLHPQLACSSALSTVSQRLSSLYLGSFFSLYSPSIQLFPTDISPLLCESLFMSSCRWVLWYSTLRVPSGPQEDTGGVLKGLMSSGTGPCSLMHCLLISWSCTNLLSNTLGDCLQLKWLGLRI